MQSDRQAGRAQAPAARISTLIGRGLTATEAREVATAEAEGRPLPNTVTMKTARELGVLRPGTSNCGGTVIP